MSKSFSSSSLSFHRSAAEANTVAWSQDQRIAVTSSEAIYILTLKRPNLPQASTADHSPPKTQDTQVMGSPLITISNALAPLKDKLTPLKLDHLLSSERILPGTSLGPKRNMMSNIDAFFSSNEKPAQSHDLFKASYWSPAGYNHLGGCILTTLTVSGRLLVYTPPGATRNTWRLALDITTHLPILLLHTPTSHINGRSGRKVASPIETTKSKKTVSKKPPNARKSASVSMVDDDSISDTIKPKRARVWSSKDPEGPDDYLQRRLLVSISTCAWSPTLLLVHGGVIGIIAIATRTGRVALIGVKLPIVIGQSRKEDDPPITLLCDYQLPLGDEKTPITEAWCSSLSWLPSTSVSTPTFYMSPGQGGRVHARLIAGCTNGQIFCLHWELNGVGGGGDGEPVSSRVSSVNGVTGVCSIAGVSRVSGCVSEITRVWEEIDNIPVYSIACQSQVSPDGSLWLVFGKSNVLMAAKLDSTYKQVNSCVKIAGYHAMTISGIAAYSKSSFVSSALDGSVQTFCLDASNIHDGHVTPSGVVMETQGEKKVTAQGVAVSEMGLFIAVSINNSDNINSRTSKKMQMNSQLHFITISSENEVENIIKEQTSCKWDICEYVRKDFTQLQKMPSPVNDLCTLMTKSKILLPVSKLQFLLQISTIMGKKEEADRCKVDITRRHIGNSLKSWLEWEKHPEDTTSGKECVDSQSSLCVQLMAQWLLCCVAHPTVSETKLANKVLGDIVPKSAHKAGSQITSPLEVCPACNDPVPLTDLRQDTCGQGHRWSRCGLTLCLATDAHCSSCLQCGATVNNALTISVEAGSWLNSLLQRHTCCIYCGGYFELVV